MDARGSVARGEALVGAYRRSGLSQVEFARRAGVGLNELQRCVRQMRRGSAVEQDGALQFVRVELSAATRRSVAPPAEANEPRSRDTEGACGVVEAELPRGVVLRFTVAAAPETMAALIASTVERLGC